jgi:UDP-glucose 4-epimerase
MRVLVTGLGGEVATRVAQLLEADDRVSEIAGFDFVPPRRRLRQTTFTRIDPRDRDRLVAFVTDFEPDAVAHLGIYEPDSRLSPRDAARATEACTVHALGAAARAGRLDRIVLRSGLEVYGRGRGRPLMPDESAPIAPTTWYGRTLLEVEALAAGIERRHDVTVSALRFAVIAGSHVPSPLGRVLRLPAVPVPAGSDPPFSMLDRDDAARAMVQALLRRHDGPLNVVGPGATSPWQAVAFGRRVPVPVAGPGWRLARAAAEFLGAPMPGHVLEVLRRGRTGDGGRAHDELELGFMRPTQEVLADLYEWATVTPLPNTEARVA